MNKQSRVATPRVPALILLVLLLSGSAPYTTRIPEEAITISAVGLPEFKTDPHVKESEGNQISGVVRAIFQDERGWLWFGTQNGLARHDGRRSSTSTSGASMARP